MSGSEAFACAANSSGGGKVRFSKRSASIALDSCVIPCCPPQSKIPFSVRPATPESSSSAGQEIADAEDRIPISRGRPDSEALLGDFLRIYQALARSTVKAYEESALDSDDL